MHKREQQVAFSSAFGSSTYTNGRKTRKNAHKFCGNKTNLLWKHLDPNGPEPIGSENRTQFVPCIHPELRIRKLYINSDLEKEENRTLIHTQIRNSKKKFTLDS
jgi:hypothetical protein